MNETNLAHRTLQLLQIKAKLCFRTLLFSSALSLVGLVAPQSAMALSGGSEEPIHIKADKAELDDQKGIAIYKGEVTITQGSSTLEAEIVTIYANDDGLIKIEATGAPAHFQQKMNEDKPTTHAYGDKIIYTHETETIKLEKNARLEQEKNWFQGDVIEYHTRNRVVTATGSGVKDEPGEKVEFVLYPKKSSKGGVSTQKPSNETQSQ